MNRSREVEAKVGIFVFLGVALIMITIMLIGGGSGLFERTLTYKATFPQAEGLVEGAVVKIAGVRVGQVREIKLLKDSGNVQITLSLNSKFKDAIHDDSIVGIRTQGVLGDRYVAIFAGSPDSPVAKDGTELKSETAKDLKDYLSTADQVLERIKGSLDSLEGILDSFHRENRSEIFFRNMTTLSSNMSSGTKDMKQSMDHLNSILAKIDNGNGTIGALVNDPSLYDDMKTLLGGANRNKVLKFFVRKTLEDQREAEKDQKTKK